MPLQNADNRINSAIDASLLFSIDARFEQDERELLRQYVSAKNLVFTASLLTASMVSQDVSAASGAPTESAPAGFSSMSLPLSASDWRFVQTPNPGGGSPLKAIMQVAEPDKSDIGLIGMMVRCGNNRLEPLLIVLDPLPPGSHADVKLTVRGSVTALQATPIPTGAGLAIPLDLESHLASEWSGSKDLNVEITKDATKIIGIIRIEALPAALRTLRDACSSSTEAPSFDRP